MELFSLRDEFRRVKQGSGEIGHRLLIDRSRYQAGIVRFRCSVEVGSVADSVKEVTHAKVDVMVYVLDGDGTLEISGESLTLTPGMFLDLPAGTPHDFSAGKEDLLLLYTRVEGISD